MGASARRRFASPKKRARKSAAMKRAPADDPEVRARKSAALRSARGLKIDGVNANQCFLARSPREPSFPIHPAAQLFPPILGREREEFFAAIAADGVRHKIVLIGEHILDGVDRHLVVSPRVRHEGISLMASWHPAEDAAPQTISTELVAWARAAPKR